MNSNISIDIQTNEKRNSFFVSSPVNNKTSFSPINVKDTLLSTDRLSELEDYKNKLGTELNLLIQIEKEKEEERMKNYTNEADEEIKRILENAITKDRLVSSKKVKTFNE